MGKCSIEFEYFSKFSIELDLHSEEDVDSVENDIIDIISDYKLQIQDIINDKRKPFLVTSQGYMVKLIDTDNIKLSGRGEEDVEQEIHRENMKER